jgi:hypothetical protein
MAKRSTKTAGKSAKVRISYHLEKPLKKVLDEAKALKGKVVEKEELDALITDLKTLQASAQDNCPVNVWYRKFTLKSATTASRKK